MFIILAVISWLGAAASLFAAGQQFPWLFLVFFAGFGAAIIGIMYFLKCPRCHGPLGMTNASLSMSSVPFYRRMNYCPYCGVSLDENLGDPT